MNVWKRITYRTPEEFHNFLMHPFLLITAAYGVGLTFFAHSEPVRQTILFKLTITSAFVPDIFTSIWGIAALVVTVLTFVGIIVRNRWLGKGVAMGGFMLWLYAFITYALAGFWLQVFIAAVPNLLFWAWFYMSIADFHRNNLEKP